MPSDSEEITGKQNEHELVDNVIQSARSLSICLRGATPPTAEGVKMLQELYSSIVGSLLVHGSPRIAPGISDIVKSILDVLSTVVVSGSGGGGGGKVLAKQFAEVLLRACGNKFSADKTRPWLQCLQSLVCCVSNHLLSLHDVLRCLSNLRGFVRTVQVIATNPSFIDVSDTTWLGWVELVNMLITVVENDSGHGDGGAMVHLYVAAVGDALTMSLQLCLPSLADANSSLESSSFPLPPVVQSRKLTAFMVRSVECLVLHAQSSSSVIPSLQQAVGDIMTRTFLHFCCRSDVLNGKNRKINDDLADMVGRLLSSTHESVRLIAATCLQNSLRVHASPLIGNEVCDAMMRSR